MTSENESNDFLNQNLGQAANPQTDEVQDGNNDASSDSDYSNPDPYETSQDPGRRNAAHENPPQQEADNEQGATQKASWSIYSIQNKIRSYLKRTFFSRKQKCPYCLATISSYHYDQRIQLEGPGIPQCTSCHHDLPYDFFNEPTPIIAVVGGQNSGKSTFLTTLIFQLMSNNKFLAANKIDVNIENKEGKEKFSEYFQTLFVDKEILEGTKNEAKKKAILIRLDKPKANNKLKSMFLTFYDTPGEEFYDYKRLLEVHPNIHNADGILFLVDPLNMEGIYKELYTAGKSNKYDDERLRLLEQSEYAILQNLRTVLRLNHKLDKKGRIEPPIAICISKFDLVEDLTPIIVEDISSEKGLGYELTEVMDDIASTSYDLEEWLLERDSKFTIGVQNLFRNHHFFAVSPLGMAPQELSKRDIEGKGVLQPFLWLLRQTKFL